MILQQMSIMAYYHEPALNQEILSFQGSRIVPPFLPELYQWIVIFYRSL